MMSVNPLKVAAILAATLLTTVALIEYAKAGSHNGSIGSIAFTSDRKATIGSFDIYRMDADGHGPTRKLTATPGNNVMPAWPPDGERIAFSRGSEGAREVYVMKAVPQNGDRNRPKNLTGNAADDSDPSWSPDGLLIAFTSDRTGDDEIWQVRIDGTDPTDLTNSPNSQDLQPAWQPLP